jgi:ubiquinone/menaquinone biosynthesis C-methylase UbiE
MKLNNKKKIVYLWSIPRSVSTAFERLFIENENFETLHEPYSESFYFSKDKQSNRYENSSLINVNCYKKITNDIKKCKNNLFIKDMAFHLKKQYKHILFGDNIYHTFIIREPIKALSSQYKLLNDFNEIEAGYSELYNLYKYINKKTKNIFIFEGDAFRNNPKETLTNYCEFININVGDLSLEWNKKEIEDFKIWKSWHKDIINSKGIKKEKIKNYYLPTSYHEILKNSEVIYDKLMLDINIYKNKKEISKYNILKNNNTKKTYNGNFSAKGEGGAGDLYESSTSKLYYVKDIGFKSLYDLTKDGLSLDVFGGSGQFNDFLKRKELNKIKLVTSDIESEQITKSINKENFPSFQLNASKMSELNNNIFDNIILAYGFHHVSPLKREKVIKESYKKLKKNGKLILKEGEFNSITSSLSHNFVDKYSTHPHIYPHPSLQEIKDYLDNNQLNYTYFDLYDPQIFFGKSKKDVIEKFNFYIHSHYSINNEKLQKKDYLYNYIKNILEYEEVEYNLIYQKYIKNNSKFNYKKFYLGKSLELFNNHFDLIEEYMMIIPRFSKCFIIEK